MAEEASEWKENLIAVGVVALVILLIWAWLGGWFAADDEATERLYNVGVDDDPMLGSPTANVTIIQFSDYYCTACAEFHRSTWPTLKERYIDTGIARFVYRDFPIEGLHPQAYKASATATCAGEQGAYWEFHDAFYEEEITEELVARLVEENALDQEALDSCRAQEWPYLEAQRDFQEGRLRGEVSGTPTFFIDGRRIVGTAPIDEFAALIEG